MDKNSVDQDEVRLQNVANTLEREIKENFYGSVKTGLWIVAMLGAVGTAGGLYTLSDIITNRIESTIDGKRAEINLLEEGIIKAFVEVQVKAEKTNREVELLNEEMLKAQSELIKLKENVEKEGADAIASFRGLVVSTTSTVNAEGESSTRVEASELGFNINTKDEASGVDTSSKWFGGTSDNTLAIAGSKFSQVGYEEGGRGAFSLKFQAMLTDPQADIDGNDKVSIIEAVTAAAAQLDKQNPVIVGEDQTFELFYASDRDSNRSKERKIYSVLVGLNIYTGKISRLAGPVADIREFEKLLSKKDRLIYEETENLILLDENASFSAIRSSIESLESKASKDDIVIFYFSGHQSSVSDPQSGEIVKALIPYDFGEGRLLYMTEVMRWLSKVPAFQRLVIIDG